MEQNTKQQNFTSSPLGLGASLRGLGGFAFGLSLLLLSFTLPAQAQNNALHFNGSNSNGYTDDRIIVPYNAAFDLTQGTFETWVKCDNVSGYRNLFMRLGSTPSWGYGWGLAIVDGNLEWWQQDSGGAGPNSTIGSVPVGVWTHIAVTVVNGGNIIFYINGVNAGSSSGALLINGGTGTLIIGKQGPHDNYFNGVMDEFRIWNVVRTQTEIQNNMHRELSGAESNLVLYYNFNQGTAGGNNTTVTTVNDLATAIGGANNGTITAFDGLGGGTTANWVGGYNNALNFDPSGMPDYVSVPYNSNLDITGTLTLSAWVNVSNANTYRNILLKGSYGYGFIIDDMNKLGYWSTSGYGSCPKFGTVTAGVWTHVAVVVVQGVSSTFYINGVQVGQSLTPADATINAGGASAVTTIGRQGDFAGNYFAGDMDEVMVWNTALNASQINTAMNIGFLGNEAGLVAYYKFNHGVANATNAGIITLVDVAGGDNNGTLTNFTLSAGTVSNWVNVEFPEINLTGNSTSIADGDASPSTTDHTDFGATLASTPLVRTFTIQNTGAGVLNITSISNTNTTDFTVGGLTLPTTIAAGSSKTFTVTLNSATLGTKNATITVNNNDANEAVYDFAITGRVINATPSGVRGNMMTFNGSNQFINAGDIDALDGASQVTYETWLYIPSGSWSNFGMIMSKQHQPAGTLRRIELALSGPGQGVNNDLLVIVADGTSNANYNTTTDVIQYDTWYHVAMVFDGTLSLGTDKLKLYVNGIQQTMTPFDASPVPALTDSNTGAFCVGSRQDGTIPFRGSLDEVRIWNAARTQAQIRESMHLTLSGAETGLVAYYQFNETSGNAIDAVAGNNGILQNTPTRPTSTVSVARGTATRLTVPTGASNQTFGNMTVNFTAMSAPATNDEFVTYQLFDRPLNNVSANNTASNYWLVRQFGTQTFSYNQMNFTLPASNVISTTAPASDMKVFKRNHNSGGTWGTEIGTGTSADNTTKVVAYSISPAQTSFSEFSVASVTSPLPITLVGFQGERVNGGTGKPTEEVKLEWTTASEIGNKGFEIQVSENAQTFKTIAFVEGRGNSTTIQSYNHTTIQPYDSYYRLKQVDFDGTFSYSPVVFVEGMAGKVMVYPNPSKGTFTINVGKDELDLPARLFNAQGVESPLTPEGGTYKVSNNLPAGVYFLHTVMAGKTKVTKIVVER